jgi:hypothetical protein
MFRAKKIAKIKKEIIFLFENEQEQKIGNVSKNTEE